MFNVVCSALFCGDPSTYCCLVHFQVKFQPVFWGLALQFYFALLILRTTAGYEAFNWLGERVSEFLDHTDAGVEFVFGKDFRHHYFALKVYIRC